MRLNIFNCSPRGKRSNTRVLAGAFAEGFLETEGPYGQNEVREYFISDPGEFRLASEVFGEPCVALIAFPIYVDAMPAIAKSFIEEIAAYKGRCSSTRMLFLIQSGFPEETHTRPMKAYLEKLAKRLGAPCDGVIRMGGGEGARDRVRGSKSGGKMFERYRMLGRGYAANAVLDEAILAKLAGPKRLPALLAPLVLPLANFFFWDRELKRNDAFGKRFDKPLE
jgi:hypothetical protein